MHVAIQIATSACWGTVPQSPKNTEFYSVATHFSNAFSRKCLFQTRSKCIHEIFERDLFNLTPVCCLFKIGSLSDFPWTLYYGSMFSQNTDIMHFISFGPIFLNSNPISPLILLTIRQLILTSSITK